MANHTTKAGPRIIQPGRLFNIETGEYSDHRTIATFVALSEINMDSMWVAYLAGPCDPPEPWESEREVWTPNGFAAFLIRQGVVLEIDVELIHVTGNDYGETPEIRSSADLEDD